MNLSVLINTVITMLALIMIGFSAEKLGIISSQFSKNLSSLIISICQPFLMISSLVESEFSIENLKTGAVIVVIGCAIHAFATVVGIATTSFFKDNAKKQITKYAMIFSNNAFFGFPVLRAIFGAEGVFWGSFYCIVYNILVWTLGIVILSKQNKDIKINAKNIFLNLGTLSVVVGLVIYVVQIPIIEPAKEAMSYISGLCTPISMLIVGSSIARMKPKQLFCEPCIYWLCIIKLIAIPLLVGLIAKLIGLQDNLVLFAAIMSGLPTAATTGAFSEQYNIIPNYASACVAVTTVLSVVTIPVIVSIFG